VSGSQLTSLEPLPRLTGGQFGSGLIEMHSNIEGHWLNLSHIAGPRDGAGAQAMGGTQGGWYHAQRALLSRRDHGLRKASGVLRGP